ncbi:hypothetical protein [Bdellovibrio sp. GT3]|uniref:hypothetical protein n=1 Tax=Bdellovibrio sp. GT3 TaxID=3136282 RepID=UPI0030F258D2
MMKPLVKMILVGTLATSTLAGCEATEESPSTGSSFTYAGLAKTWTSGCITATDGIVSSANRTKIDLTLNGDGSFSHTQYWFTGGSCISYAIYYRSAGTFTIGSATGALYPLAFTVTSSAMMAWNTSVQANVNTACGGSSPYQSTPSASDNGMSKSTYMMTCSSMVLPNSSNKFVDNVASLSGGVLSLGQNQNGVPGEFQGGSVPTSTSVDFY